MFLKNCNSIILWMQIWLDGHMKIPDWLEYFHLDGVSLSGCWTIVFHLWLRLNVPIMRPLGAWTVEVTFNFFLDFRSFESFSSWVPVFFWFLWCLISYEFLAQNSGWILCDSCCYSKQAWNSGWFWICKSVRSSWLCFWLGLVI